MSGKRQKNQLVLAFLAEDTGEARRAAEEGTETLTAKRKAESPALGEQLMEEVCEWENCKQALKRVKTNKGSPGVDGMTVGDLPGYLKQHWPAIREQLLVLDRVIQQAVMQLLQRRWDRTFSEHSYGFRPGRLAHQEVAQTQQYMAAGCLWVGESR